jgi:DNA polymerase-1
MSGPLLVVDAPSLLYRAFFGLPSSITDGDGHQVNALLGFANMTLKVIDDYSPRATVCCFGLEAATYRVEAHDGYHADRPPVPDELQWQWDRVDRFFTAFGWTIASTDEYEADDVLGSLARAEEAAGGTCLILTGDRDMYQCATDAVTVLYVKTGTGVEEVTPAGVEERYGIKPSQVPDFIALRGDPSDGIPGAKGIGEKGAADLLQRNGSLEAALENAMFESPPRTKKALMEQADELRTYLDMATLRHIDVSLPPDTPLDREGGAAAARELGMNRLAERLLEGVSS